MQGSCHCGNVSVAITRQPEYINLCDCSLCLKSGGAWGYFSESEIKVAGSTRAYRRKDYKEPAVEMQFCGECGATTHWVLTEHCDGDRVGVNMRLFAPDEITGIEARTLDGRNWFGKTDAAHRREPGKVGSDVFL